MKGFDNPYSIWSTIKNDLLRISLNRIPRAEARTSVDPGAGPPRQTAVRGLASAARLPPGASYMEKPRMSPRPLLLAFLAVSLLSQAPILGAMAEPAATPVPSGRISFHGRVLDPAGMPISGARVTAETEGRASVPVIAVSDADGQFILELRHRPVRRARGGGRVRGNGAAREPHAGRPPSPRPRPAGGSSRNHHRAAPRTATRSRPSAAAPRRRRRCATCRSRSPSSPGS